MSRKKIGIFDSGIGGLSVLSTIQKLYPFAQYVYFGDNKNLPYGNKKPRQILEFSREIVKFLVAQGVEIIVMGCNSSSAVALNTLRSEFSIPIIDIITPIAEQTAQLFQNIAVIATQVTVTSNAYENKFKSFNHKLKVIQVACPKLAPLIECGNFECDSTFRILEEYLQPIVENTNIEALICGCTHYSHLSPMIKKIIPPTIQLLHPADFLTCHLKRFIEKEEYNDAVQPVEYFISGNVEQFFDTITKLSPTVGRNVIHSADSVSVHF